MNQHTTETTGCLLNIGGITPLTTIDYPDHLSAVIFCQGCPWRCRYCHNSELISRYQHTSYQWPAIVEKLKQRSGFLDAVVFSGGEPTLQKDLPEAIKDVKKLGFKVGLHTAGCYPKRLEKLLPKLDWVGLDIKAQEDDYESITGVPGSGQNAWESLRILNQSDIEHDIRITVYERLLPENKLHLLIRKLASMGVQSLTLQQCQEKHSLNQSELLFQKGSPGHI